MSATEDEKIKNVHFEEIGASPFLKPIRMHFERIHGDQSKKMMWDLSVEHDSVACIIFHRQNNVLLFVKQFRPPVFVRRVRALPENVGKPLNEIKFGDYPLSIGMTIELCAGLMDKAMHSPLQTIQEEILEECGYKVPENNIKLIKQLVSNVSISGSRQHLFYTEIDESMKETEGGGNLCEGEFIEKVFLSIDEAKRYINEPSVDSPPGLLFGITWFLNQLEKNDLPML